MPYREIIVDGKKVVQTLTDFLPTGATIAMRKEGGGVDSSNFLEWASKFVEHVRPLTCGGRKVLLTYDGYRAHMSLPVLTKFLDGGVIAYALPSHTSGKTQPLDLVAFSRFKAALKAVVSSTVVPLQAHSLDLYNYCDCLRVAYKKAFTPDNISAGFKRAGLWPFDPTRLLGTPRPESAAQGARLVSVDELMRMMVEKKRLAREGCARLRLHRHKKRCCTYLD